MIMIIKTNFFRLCAKLKVLCFLLTISLNYLLIPIGAQAQDHKIETGNFFVNNYSRSFLNSEANNWGVIQDKDGLIYLSNTAKGVLIYDGQSIKRVLDVNGTPKTGLTREMEIDSKNTMYATIGQFNFGYIEKNEYGESIYTSLSEQLPVEKRPKTNIWGLAMHNDTVVIQSEKAVYVYKYKKLLNIISFNNITHTLQSTPNGINLRVWGEGFFRFANGKFNLIQSTKDVFAQNRIDANYLLANGDQLLVSRNNGAWYLKKDNSLVKADAKTMDEYAIKGKVYHGNLVLSNGIIPMTTDFGLVFFDQNLQLKTVLNTDNGLKYNHVSGYTQDRTGDVWGVSNELFKVSFDTTLTYFSTTNGLHGVVDGINRYQGKLYIQTSSDLFDFNPKSKVQDVSKFEDNGINDAVYNMISFDDQVITTNNYSIKTTKNRVTQVVSNIYRSLNSIQSELNPSLLFSTNYAYGLLLHQYKNGKWSQIPIKSKNNISCIDIVELKPGILALSTVTNGNYIYKYDLTGQGEFIKLESDKLNKEKGLLKFQLFNDQYYLAYDNANNFYSFDLKNNALKYIGVDKQKFKNIIKWGYSYNPKSKNGWIVSDQGIYKTDFDPNKGFSFKQYPFYKVELGELSYSIFGEGQGDNEVLWIGSQDDKVYRFLPELANKEHHEIYSALIRGVFANDNKIPLQPGTLPFNKNNLRFEVAYPVFGNETKTTFSYWLEGQDSTWSSFVSDFKKEYTNLSDGKYIFHVRAKDASGEISKSTVLEFKISPPWYRTIWAYGIYLLALIICFIQFGKYQARKSFLKAEHERKNSELAAAKDLQDRLLPKTLPSIENLDIAGYLRTSTEVGGDYYDFFEQNDGSLYAICGDATGHGTPSGMLVSITKAGLIGLPEMEPKAMLHELNRVVKKVDLGILRMSLNIAHIKGNLLTLSSAGMPPYFIYRAASKTTEEIQLSGIPLGSFKSVTYDQTTTHFSAGDILVIISDGLPEAPNLEGELFDYLKLQNLISTYGNQTAQGVIDSLMTEADTWLSGKHNPDDITLVVIKHK